MLNNILLAIVERIQLYQNITFANEDIHYRMVLVNIYKEKLNIIMHWFDQFYPVTKTR